MRIDRDEVIEALATAMADSMDIDQMRAYIFNAEAEALEDRTDDELIEFAESFGVSWADLDEDEDL